MTRTKPSFRLGSDVFELEARTVLSSPAVTSPVAILAPMTASLVQPTRIIDSVVTIQNPTGNTLAYQIQFGSTTWQSVTLQPGQVKIHVASGANRLAYVRFDGLAAAGYQEARMTLASKNSVVGGPERWVHSTADGQRHSFQVNSARNGWVLMQQGGIDKTHNASLRSQVTGFENLGTEFEIIGSSTGMSTTPGSYNCISWTLGNVRSWTFPTDLRGAANDLRYWDSLYGQLGYRRLSTLDLRLQPGVQKVVVYYGQNSGFPGFTHAALQESDGMWSSKLGGGYLIKHVSPYQVAGATYGQPAVVYARVAV